MTKNICFLILLYMLLVPVKVFACGNAYFTPDMPISGSKLELKKILTPKGDMLYPYWSQAKGDNLYERRDSLYDVIFNPKKVGRRREADWYNIEVALDNNVDFRLLSDFAWYELKLYDKSIAVRLLEVLYKEHPNEYNVIANLGTAYEVTGNNKKALELLRKAVALNPSSHYGSEWIHIRILEQKLSFSPDYPAITGLGIGNVNDWLKDKNYKFPQPPDSLLKQIAYQLHERIFFVSPPDKAVGQLVMDFANIAAKQYGAGNAEDFYTYALRYDTTLRNKMPVQYLPEKINADSLAENNLPDKKGLGISIPLLLAIPAVLLPLTFYLYKKYFSRRK